MKQLLLAIILLGSMCVKVCAQEAAVGTVRGMVECAGAVSDAQTRRLLKAHKQREDIPLPAALYHLLNGLDMVRVQGGHAYSWREGRHALAWWFSDLATAGAPEEVRQRVDAALIAAQLHRSGEGRYVSSPTRCGVEARIEGFQPFVGSPRQTTGWRLTWRVYSMEKSLPLTLEGLLATIPSLRDDRVHPEIVARLGKNEVASLSVGGTWTRYYDWDLALTARSDVAARELREEIEQLLSSLGYKQQDAGSGTEREWAHPERGSHAWVDCKGKGVQLRIQPQS